ncbi:MAG: hypothetical protein ACLFSA_01835 [Spirochaetaceae bacterium]
MTKEYVLHLLTEISNYVLESHPSRMVVSLHQEEDGLHLAVIDDHKRTEEELEKIRKALNTSVRPELSEYYGAMGGTDLIGAARLNLLGWQIKRADVYQRDNGTQIDLWIGGDHFDSDKFTIPD